MVITIYEFLEWSRFVGKGHSTVLDLVCSLNFQSVLLYHM